MSLNRDHHFINNKMKPIKTNCPFQAWPNTNPTNCPSSHKRRINRQNWALNNQIDKQSWRTLPLNHSPILHRIVRTLATRSKTTDTKHKRVMALWTKEGPCWIIEEQICHTISFQRQRDLIIQKHKRFLSTPEQENLLNTLSFPNHHPKVSHPPESSSLLKPSNHHNSKRQSSPRHPSKRPNLL